MPKSAIRKTWGMGAFLALTSLTACFQPENGGDPVNTGNPELKTLSTQLGQPYLLNEQGEVIAEIPPFVLERMKVDLKQQARMAEAFELENMYDSETGKLKDFGRLAEIQNRVDKLANRMNLTLRKGGNP